MISNPRTPPGAIRERRNMKKATKPVSIRIPETILALIEQEGEKEMRSVSNMIIILITEALEKRK